MRKEKAMRDWLTVLKTPASKKPLGGPVLSSPQRLMRSLKDTQSDAASAQEEQPQEKEQGDKDS